MPKAAAIKVGRTNVDDRTRCRADRPLRGDSMRVRSFMRAGLLSLSGHQEGDRRILREEIFCLLWRAKKNCDFFPPLSVLHNEGCHRIPSGSLPEAYSAKALQGNRCRLLPFYFTYECE